MQAMPQSHCRAEGGMMKNKIAWLVIYATAIGYICFWIWLIYKEPMVGAIAAGVILVSVIFAWALNCVRNPSR